MGASPPLAVPAYVNNGAPGADFLGTPAVTSEGTTTPDGAAAADNVPAYTALTSPARALLAIFFLLWPASLPPLLGHPACGAWLYSFLLSS